MYKAVFIDMDGTLLRKDHTVSDYNRSVIQRLLQQGIKVVPVSARPLHGIRPITDAFLSPQNALVSLNGSYIYENGELLYDVAVGADQAAGIHEKISSLDVTPMYYTKMDWYADRDNEKVKKEQRITPVSIIIQPFEQILQTWQVQQTGPNKILLTGDSELLNEVEAHLKERYHDSLNVYKSQATYLEVIPAAASKTKAVQMLMQQWGIERHEIIALGDNYNDQEMIQFAGTGVAMGNAPASIQAIADYVTDTNNEDGVAKALEHYIPA